MSEVRIENIELLKKILAHFSPEDKDEDFYNQQILMESIQPRNSEIYQALKDFFLALESLQFISTDHQLRLKAADIWKMQKDMFANVLITRAKDLEDAAKKFDLDIGVEIKRIVE